MKARGSSRTKSVGEAIEELIAQLGIKKKLHEQDAFVVWDEAVGERIAKVATPTRMLRGTLIVSEVRRMAERAEHEEARGDSPD